MGNLTISLVAAYVLSGIGYIAEGLAANVVSQPGWARRPTLVMLILVGLTWPVSALINNISRRDMAFAAFNLITAFLLTMGWVYLVLLLSEHLFESMLARLVTVAIILHLSSRLILPRVRLLAAPIVFVLAIPLDWIFPLDERSKKQRGDQNELDVLEETVRDYESGRYNNAEYIRKQMFFIERDHERTPAVESLLERARRAIAD